jgi:hypothetical protein
MAERTHPWGVPTPFFLQVLILKMVEVQEVRKCTFCRSYLLALRKC